MLISYTNVGTGALRSFLSGDPISEITRFYYESGLERSEIKIATMLLNIAHYGWRRTRHSSIQVCFLHSSLKYIQYPNSYFRVIECKGPTNTRVYTVAVYFRGRRLASAVGHSIQQAEMNAAKKALEISQGRYRSGLC